MKLSSSTAAAALVVGALAVGFGTAHAAPAPAPADIAYSVKLVDHTVVAKLAGGTFALSTLPGATPEAPAQQVLDIKDATGALAAQLPLNFRLAGTQIPVQPQIGDNGASVALVPTAPTGLVVDTSAPIDALAVPAPAAPAAGQAPAAAQLSDIASDTENQRAMADFSTKFGLATSIGTFVGTALGCILTIFVGCAPGAAVGGIVGTMLTGGPVLMSSGIDLLNTMRAAPGTTRWTDQALAAAAAQGGDQAASRTSAVPAPAPAPAGDN
ncbi:hypothetical protein [Nocardia stercoris]|uniref:hypothetical protein n=1 Tax=Nocardia stercoris TaxID=2483361 RepID=UPI0018F6B1BF|nr:hypothetical protein [Nocardia stercoris]